MELTLFRHGIAEDQGPDGSDASRRLTEEGVTRTTACAKGLATILEKPDVILTSPKARARATADILGKQFGLEPQVEDVIADGVAQDVLDMLSTRPEYAVMIVGHEPILSGAIAIALSMRGGSLINMKKAGCAHLTISWSPSKVTRSILHWHLTPKILRSLA